MSPPAAVLNILVTANTATATASLTKLDASMKRSAATANTTSTAIGTRLSKAAALGGKAIGGGLVYGLYKGVKAGAEFEKQMSALGAVADASTKDMEKLEKQALKMGKSTAFSANEVAVAQTELAKGGLKVKQIIGGGLPAALSLAAAGELELGEAAATTVNAMKLFGLQAKDATKVADMLATAANTTTADVADFAMAMRQGGAAAKLAGLDMNETVTILEALAEAGVKNSDAGTSMKTALLQLINPTEKQADLAEALGVNFVKANGEMMNGVGISKQLRDATVDMEKAERAKTFAILAGTDGVRTLNALYEAGPEKLKGFSKANEELGTANELAKKKMDNTAGSVEKLMGSLETLAVEGWLAIQPAVRDAIDAVDKFVKEFSQDIKKLGLEEALQNALGKVVEGAAKLGVKAVEAFGKAFWNSDLLTRLFLGAAVFKMFGGKAVVESGGKAMGRVLGRGMVLGAVLALPALVPEAFKLGQKIGAKIREGVEKAMEDIKDLLDPVWDELTNSRELTLDDFGGPLEATKTFLKQTSDYAETQAKLVEDFGLSARRASALTNKALRGDMTGTGQKLSQLDKDYDKFASGSSRSLERSSSASDRHAQMSKQDFDSIMGTLDKGTTAATNYAERNSKSFDKVTNKSGQMAKGAAGNVGGLARAVTTGFEIIATATQAAMKAFGITKAVYAVEKAGNKVENALGAVQGHQRGGVIVPGQGDGDKVPAMLEPGEVVWNKKAVAAMGGAGRANAVNKKVPRFATGGVVEALGPYSIDPFTYDANHAGGNSHWHIAMSTPGAVVAVGKKLQQMGFMVGEHPAFGGVQASHAPGSYHYSDQAIDVNSTADETRAETAQVARLLSGSGAIGAALKNIKRVLLDGPDGPLRSLGQSALDKVRQGANDYIGKHSIREGAETGASISSDGNVEKVFADVAKKLSTSKTASLALGMAGYAESGMRDLSYGDASSQGALQLLSSTASGMGINPHDEGAIASAFLQQGYYGKGGANSLAASGLPAHLVAQNVQGSAFSDGSNYLAQAGPAKAWMARFGLRTGGIVQKLAKGGKAKPSMFGPLPPGFSSTPSGPGWSHGNLQYGIDELNKAKGIMDWASAFERTAAASSEHITTAETLHAMWNSEAGSDLSAGERSQQIALQKKLLEDLSWQAGFASQGLSMASKGLPRATGKTKSELEGLQSSFVTMLDTLQGITGEGGSIFNTRMAISRLEDPGTPLVSDNTAELLSLTQQQLLDAQRRLALSQAQLPVFQQFAGMFANGGSIGAGKWGIAGERGPEVVRGPAQVYSANQSQGMFGGEINVYVDPFSLDVEVERIFDGKRQKVQRQIARRTPSGAL